MDGLVHKWWEGKDCKWFRKVDTLWLQAMDKSLDFILKVTGNQWGVLNLAVLWSDF